MKVDERKIQQAVGTILLHNVADGSGRRTVRKGSLLTEGVVSELADMGLETVEVAVLGAGDAHEDEAAQALAEAMQTQVLTCTRAAGGRANLRAESDGLLEVDAERLLTMNCLPGFAVATRRQHTVVGPGQETDNVATVKIVPFAVARRDLERAVELARGRPGVIEVRCFRPGRRVAMLFVAEPAAQKRTREEYLAPTATRLARLGAKITATDAVGTDETAIAAGAARLAAEADLLIVAGQTSIMDDEDTALRALRRVGADLTLSGAPVEPGNLLALAYLPGCPVLLAPGCAKGMKRNVVDLVLPRLLLGDRLERRDVAGLGLGGFLTAAERGGDAG